MLSGVKAKYEGLFGWHCTIKPVGSTASAMFVFAFLIPRRHARSVSR